MDRVIFHCDLNCFYASVELLSHLELREVPVAVAGDPASRHGIILAKNEPAKQCGVKTAETIWQAKKKCPNLVLLPAHHKLYREYSKKVNAIYDEYTDLAESFGIDESWLDVTNTLHLFGIAKRKRNSGFPLFLLYIREQNYKPGSVFDSHLSRRTVAGTLKPPRERPGQPWDPKPLLPYRCCSG